MIRVVSVAAKLSRPVFPVLLVYFLFISTAYAESFSARWQALMIKGDRSAALKHYPVALDYYKEAASLARKQREAWRERIMTGQKLCELHTRLGHMHVASRVCQQVLASSTRRFGKATLPSARAALNLARLKMKQGDMLATVRLAKKVVNIAKKRRRDNPSFYLLANRFMGTAYEKIVNLQGARKSWLILYREQEKVLGVNNPALLDSARAIFRIVLGQQDYRACIHWGERIARLSPPIVSGATRVQDQLFYIKVASCYYHVARPDAAIHTLKTAFPRMEKILAESQLGLTLRLHLARYYSAVGNLRETESWLAVARKAVAGLAKKSDSAGIEARIRIAGLYRELGKLPMAVKFYDAAIKQSRKLPDFPRTRLIDITIRLAVVHCMTGNRAAARKLVDGIAVDHATDKLQLLHLLSLQLYLEQRKNVSRRLMLANRLTRLAEKYFPFAHGNNAVFNYYKYRVLSDYRNDPRALSFLRKATGHWQRSSRYLADRSFLSSNILMLKFRPEKMYRDLLGMLLSSAKHNSGTLPGGDAAETIQVVSVLNMLRKNPVKNLYIPGTYALPKKKEITAGFHLRALRRDARMIALVQRQYAKVRNMPANKRHFEYEVLLRDHIVRSLGKLAARRKVLYRNGIYGIPAQSVLRQQLAVWQKSVGGQTAVLSYVLDPGLHCVLVMSRATVRLVPLVFDRNMLQNWLSGKNLDRFNPDLHLLIPAATLLADKKSLDVVYTRNLKRLLTLSKPVPGSRKNKTPGRAVWNHHKYRIRFLSSIARVLFPTGSSKD